MIEYEDSGYFGVTFTEGEFNTVRQWVQDRAAQEIVATPKRLYLPVGEVHMETVDDGDEIWWDPSGGVNAFSLARPLPVETPDHENRTHEGEER